MAASTLDLELEQGATYRRQLVWKQSAEGDPVDLTGYSARMQVRRHPSSTDVLVSLTSTPAAGLALGGPAGTIDLVLTAAQTAELPADVPAAYDLLLTKPDGDVVRFLQGAILTSAGVTRG